MISRLYALHRDNTKERAHHLMIHILYNPLAGSGRSEEKAREAASLLAPRETEILDIGVHYLRVEGVFWISPRWIRPPL